MKSLRTLALCVTLLVIPCAAGKSVAEPIRDPDALRLLATGGPVSIWFAGTDAAFDHHLFLVTPRLAGPFFPTHSTPVGSREDLGLFAARSELTFMLHVLTTGDRFFTGAASRNPDGVLHARGDPWAGSTEIPSPGIRVQFEDWFGGGDRDFNDYAFVVSNVTAAPVPEPTSMLLAGAAAAGLLLRRRLIGRGR